MFSYTVFKRKLVDYFKKKNEENETRDRLDFFHFFLLKVYFYISRVSNEKK